jgi:hypothetical protein
MWFFWGKLHIKVTFRRGDHFGSGVTSPWIFYYRTYAGNTFQGVFSLHRLIIWLYAKVLWCCQFITNNHLYNHDSSPKVGPLVMVAITPASSFCRFVIQSLLGSIVISQTCLPLLTDVSITCIIETSCPYFEHFVRKIKCYPLQYKLCNTGSISLSLAENFDSMTAAQCKLITLTAKFWAVLGTSINIANFFWVLASEGFHIVSSECVCGRFAFCVANAGFPPFFKNHLTDITTVQSWKCFKTIAIV